MAEPWVTLEQRDLDNIIAEAVADRCAPLVVAMEYAMTAANAGDAGKAEAILSNALHDHRERERGERGE